MLLWLGVQARHHSPPPTLQEGSVQLEWHFCCCFHHITPTALVSTNAMVVLWPGRAETLVSRQ